MGLFFAAKLTAQQNICAAMSRRLNSSSRFFLYLTIVLSGSVVEHSFAALDKLPLIGEKLPFTISATNNSSLEKSLEEALKAQRKESATFREINRLRSAGRFDRDIILRWLRSEGYFAASLNTRYEGGKIYHQVSQGPHYLIETLTVNFPADIAAPPLSSLPLQTGKPLRAEDVLAGQNAIRDFAANTYCLYEINVNYDAEVNHSSHQAFVSYTLAPSPQVVFGPSEIGGLSSIESEYLENYITLQEGDCFKRRQIELSRLALLQTNLLTRVDITIGEPVDGAVPFGFDLAERNHRTLRAGISYDSNIGPGVTLGWEHRNLLHRGEHFDAQTNLSEIKREIKGELTVPHFRRRGQTLVLHSNLTHEIPDAYESTAGEVGIALSRELKQNWAASVGSTLEFSRVIENTQKNDFSLLSFPMRLDFIRTNDLLDPRYGWAFGVQTRPFVDLYQTGTRFLKTTMVASVYLTESDWWGQPTLAMRAATGTINGEELRAVPAAHRYYVGGGGSVRGYAYQTVGELTEREPNGGLSFGETSVELRLRLTQSWGAVLFADGGYAYPGESPSFGEDFLWGAGVGVRYFTSFAPIRLDLAAPLNKRTLAEDGVQDDSVQVYISIGQAF
jgi:translocation and assembly module TamA